MPAPNGHGPIPGSTICATLPAPITLESNRIATNAAITKS
jgi:hypothetical protein